MNPVAAESLLLLLLLLLLLHSSSSALTNTNAAAHTDDKSDHVKVFCNDEGFTAPKEPWKTAKYYLLNKMANDTFSQAESRYWTSYTSGDGLTLYGYASCAKYMLCAKDAKTYGCLATSAECYACLVLAKGDLTSRCRNGIDAHVTEHTDLLECYMKYSKTKFW